MLPKLRGRNTTYQHSNCRSVDGSNWFKDLRALLSQSLRRLCYICLLTSLRSADVFPVVASLHAKKNGYFSEGEKRRPEMRPLFAGYTLTSLVPRLIPVVRLSWGGFVATSYPNSPWNTGNEAAYWSVHKGHRQTTVCLIIT